MQRLFVAAVLIAIFNCPIAYAQSTGGMSGATAAPMPSINATSPLGVEPNAPVQAIGIPLGSTEIDDLGVSPPVAITPSDPNATMSSPCSTAGMSSGSISGGSMLPSGC